MIISYDHKFIFIHIYKVAGTSVKHALSDFLPWYSKVRYVSYLADLIGSLSNNSKYTPFFSKHARAIDVKKNLPDDVYNSFFKFVFVRNPWEWQVSLYFYILKDKYHHHHKLVKSMSGFDEFIKWHVTTGPDLQKDFIVDGAGNVIVDYIGRYENLQDDFNNICERIGIKPRQLPHSNKSKHTDYKDYYNDHTLKLVEEAFKEDIDMFGYSFE